MATDKAMAAEKAPGEIYDLGYRHYDGPRLGRAGAVRALYVEGLRTIFGFGRPGRSKAAPLVLIVMMVIPAIIQAALGGLVGSQLQIYRPETYFGTIVWLFGLFCAFQTPEMVTSDRQYRLLALYFSRPVFRSDYVLARVGALATALFGVAMLPYLIILAGRWFAAPEFWPAFQASAPLLPRSVLTALAISLLLATISLAISALIPRRPLATGAILGLYLLSSAFTEPLIHNRPDKMAPLVFVSPMFVAQGVNAWIFDTTTVSPARDSLFMRDRSPPPPEIVAPKNKPDSIARRERRIRRERMTILQYAHWPGAAYLGALVGYLLLAGGVLTLRYRNIDI